MAMNVVYVLPDKRGGVLRIVSNLLAYRHADGCGHHAVLTRNRLDGDAGAGTVLKADSQTVVDYALPRENLHTVMRRVARAIPKGEGVYVASDLLDLATASVHDFGRAVIFMLHGDIDYYYDLAVSHETTIDAFIAYSRRMYDELVARLPHRATSVFHLPYGVPVPADARTPAAGPLRLVYAGRLEHGQKGVLDLPEIDRALAAEGVRCHWTIAGEGPDGDDLRRRWSFNPDVRFVGSVAAERMPALLAAQDVFILPTRFEGLPCALLEAMASGVVPVVSDIPSGIPELVSPGTTGDRCPAGDVRAFAAAIRALDEDRGQLETMSSAARHLVQTHYDIRHRVADYQALYVRWQELYRRRASWRHLRYGSRLDRRWIPNRIVTAVRGARWRRS